MLYLFVRDGGASLLASHLPSRFRPRDISSPKLPAALLAQIDLATIRALIPVPLRDYALSADGAMVLDELTSPLDTSNLAVGPHLALDKDLRIGRCWRFPGPNGQLGISIPEFIRPTHVSINHIPRVIAVDIGEDYSFIKLAEFVYDIAKEHTVQTYPVRSDIDEVVIDIGLFVLEILENWGAASTCLYRVRIHGVPSGGGRNINM
ncbi:hypothetical protein C8Q79DRAFT_1007363 [Trametes meyenii]|nr:hypothetical protein C8Q79DRAFT_1007363 [Trametes meyenii]